VKYVPHWLPGAGFKRYARSVRHLDSLRAGGPFSWAKENIVRSLSLVRADR
jgi:hypothetical protein